ncbi:tyrosine/serine/threonine protein phosphatase [Cryptotrichosporon argae]
MGSGATDGVMQPEQGSALEQRVRKVSLDEDIAAPRSLTFASSSSSSLSAAAIDGAMPPTPSSLTSPARSSSSRNSSPPSLPPVLHLKRGNPKRLSLSLTVPPASSSFSSPSTITPSAVDATPTSPGTDTSSRYASPYTPGPPRTPALAMTMCRAAGKGMKRPSLLSLITMPPSNDVPPTPGAVMHHPYATVRLPRGRGRARASTSAETYLQAYGERTLHTAVPGFSRAFTAIDKRPSAGPPFAPTFADPISLPRSPVMASPSASTTSLASSASTSASPQRGSVSSADLDLEPLNMGPYANGPVELVPGVWLGAEDSVWRWDVWAPHAPVVGVLNVAQEISDPFASGGSPGLDGKVALAMYGTTVDRPTVHYAHLRWSHGEGGLSEVDSGARLNDLAVAPEARVRFRFWDAIRWLEVKRKAGMPVLIHCQCGVSRSATLAIAYLMALAASGAMPDLLGHLASMQDAYEFVKARSRWIGPNVSLVFQLVEFARNLTALLPAHAADPRGPSSWPTLADVESEAEWARRRREFDVEANSPGGAGDEARRLDEEMVERRKWRA